MAEVVCIEYCRGCDRGHPLLRHDQYRYIGLFRECSQLLKLDRFEVRAVNKPRIGAFVVSLNNTVVYEKEEFEELPQPQQVLRIVREEKQRQWYYRKAVASKQQRAAESLQRLNKLIGNQHYANRSKSNPRDLNIPVCLWKRPKLNTNSRSALTWYWRREDQKKRGQPLIFKTQTENPEYERTSFRCRPSESKSVNLSRPLTGKRR